MVTKVDTQRLAQVIRDNIETLCKALFPNGKRIRNEWRVGDLGGSAGDSLGIQLVGDKAGLWHDRATDEGGDFLKAVMARLGLEFLGAVDWVERTLGVNLRVPESAGGKKEETQSHDDGTVAARRPFDWDSCVAALSDVHLKRLADWRGYSLPFCEWLKKVPLIGLYNGNLAFPVADSSGTIIGCHCCVRKKHDWFYTPGCKALPLIVGNVATAVQVHVFESYWDAFAFADKMKLHESADCGTALIVTRGSGNGKVVRGLFPAEERCEVFIWPQRDIPRDGTIPSQEWLTAVLASAGRTVRVAWISDATPDCDFDLNDWTRQGASASDILKALKIAEVHEQKEPAASVCAPVENADFVENASESSSRAGLQGSPNSTQAPTLSEQAFYGLFGRIARMIEPHTEAASAAILAQLLVVFGNLIGRLPYFYVEGVRHCGNLFVCLVGQSSKGRKGTSLAHILRLARFVDPDWFTERVATGLSSGEGLIWAVRDPIFKPERNKKTGQVDEVKVDNGVDDKRLFVAETEFAQALKVMSRPTNILSTVIRCAWDSGNLRTLVKNDPARASNAHISIVGHITLEELKRELSQCDLFNGFANRFGWFVVKRSKLLPEGGQLPESELTEIAGELRKVVEHAAKVGEMRRDEQARQRWHEIYPRVSAEGAGLAGSVTNRAEALILRFSMLYALSDGSSEIRLDHLQAALALWEYCAESAQYLFGDRLADQNAQRILDALRATPEGLTRTEISAQVFDRNITKEALSAALQVLASLEFAKCEPEETGGRPAERWYAITK